MTAVESQGKGIKHEIVVPPLGESIQEGVIARWLKRTGDSVREDEPIAELETDKITVELRAPVAGVLVEQRAAEGQTVKIGAHIGAVEAGAGSASKPAPAAKAATDAPVTPTTNGGGKPSAGAAPVRAETTSKAPATKSAPAAETAAPRQTVEAPDTTKAQTTSEPQELSRPLSPSMRRALRERGGQESGSSTVTFGQPAAASSSPVPSGPTASPGSSGARPQAQSAAPARVDRKEVKAEEIVPLSPLRRRIAERLVAAKNGTASLTTFNEVDMSAVIALRERAKATFQERHGVKLGFMSIFTKACIAALRSFPGINAELRDDAIVYKNHYDIGIAVGSARGLVVPVIRDADKLSFAEIEHALVELGTKARENKLTLDDLSGGTFTITNGGVFGSMLSTPLLNPPQTGILGMHNIVKRPVAVGDKVEVHPVMYVALTYDHRVVDGREAVQFLVAVKELVENPEQMLLEM